MDHTLSDRTCRARSRRPHWQGLDGRMRRRWPRAPDPVTEVAGSAMVFSHEAHSRQHQRFDRPLEIGLIRYSARHSISPSVHMKAVPALRLGRRCGCRVRYEVSVFSPTLNRRATSTLVLYSIPHPSVSHISSNVTAQLSDRQVQPARLARLGVQIATCGCDRRVPQRLLDDGHGGALVEGVRGVRMA